MKVDASRRKVQKLGRTGMGDFGAFVVAGVVSVVCVVGVFGAVFLFPSAPKPKPIVLTKEQKLAMIGDVEAFKSGRALFGRACVTCHTLAGDGIEKMGISLKGSSFLREASLGEIGVYIKEGVPLGSGKNKSGMVMPPGGGSPFLNPKQLNNLAVYSKALAQGTADAVEDAVE